MSHFFIRRPIVAMVIAIIMLIVGLVCMAGLPIAQFPNIVPPQIQVQTTYVGADALTVEASVATPIEQQMSGVEGMEYMYSINANNGMYTLNIIFDTSTVPTTDQILAQMRQTQASSQLPQDVRNFGVTVDQSASSPLGVFVLYSPKGTYDPHFSRQLLLHQYQRPDDACPGHRQRKRFRRRPIRHAYLGSARPPRHTQHHRAGNHQGRPGPERRQSRRADRRRTRPSGPGFHLHGQHARAAWSPRRTSRTSSFAPIPMARSCGVKDVARSNLGSQVYNLRGASTAKTRPSWPFTSSRVPTR